MISLHDRRTARRLVWLLGAAGPLVAQAHEFWIVPSTFTPAPNTTVQIALRVGDHYQGQPVPRDGARIDRFAAVAVAPEPGAPSETPVVGLDGADPAGGFVASHEGLIAVVYDSNHASIELDGAKFDAYLAEKGLTAIRTAREQRGQGSRSAREIYSRCAKALLFTGDAERSAGLRDRSAGLPLEIVARFNPYTQLLHTDMAFQVLFDGRPLPDIQVRAFTEQDQAAVQLRRTDAGGIVTFRLHDAGPWLIECTHMIESPQRPDVDYESIWASLTFRAPAAEVGP